MELSAVILAGGESRRMGRDKAWLEIEGRPLIVRQVAMARELGAREVFISGRAGVDYSSLRCPVLFDLEPGLGPLGGLERGLHAASGLLVLVLAVDLPRMTATFLRKLLAECGDATGAVPKYAGRLEPLAAIYPKRCHALAGNFIARSCFTVRDFAEACARESAVRIVNATASDAGCFANWNAPADVFSTTPTARPGRPFHPRPARSGR